MAGVTPVCFIWKDFFPIVWACLLVYKFELDGGFSVVSEPPSSPPRKRGTSLGGKAGINSTSSIRCYYKYIKVNAAFVKEQYLSHQTKF